MLFSRRRLIALGAAGFMAIAALPALAGNVVTYLPDVLQNAIDSGEPYLLDFSATWCSTCKVQERVLDKLQAQSADYNSIQIIRVDWDTNRSGPLVAALAIPRRSTLVLLRGEDELGRVVAQTSESSIAALLDLGA